MLKGAVEIDETCVGGRPRIKGVSKRGRGTSKTPVNVLVERETDGVRCKPIQRVDGKTLREDISACVAKEAVMMTDELGVYIPIGRNHPGGHMTVNHGAGEYARVTEHGLVAHTTTAESFFGLLKRGHYGILHQFSRRHLHRYCDELSFRWLHRHISDGERFWL